MLTSFLLGHPFTRLLIFLGAVFSWHFAALLGCIVSEKKNPMGFTVLGPEAAS